MDKRTAVATSEDAKGWGSRLSMLLRRTGMTQKELAKRVGVTPMAVSKWIAGGGIGDDKLDEVCEALSTSHTWLRWGEDAFSSEIWEERSEAGNRMLRTFMHGGSRLDISTMAEAYLGFVMWTFDSETGFWQWSSNTPKFFNLDRSAVESTVPTHALIKQKVQGKRDLLALQRLFVDLESGARRSGWGRFSLTHMPDKEFLYMARAVQTNCSHARIIGITAISTGLVGQLAMNDYGPRNCYE